MASWRPAAAGGAAFLASMFVEVGAVAALGDAVGGLAMPVLVAPLAEELAKRLFLWPLGAGWAGTGLAFGVIEGLLKTGEWHLLGLWGGLASVLQHWAYGRWAERGGLWLAIALHMAFNATVLGADYATDASVGWVGPLLAAALLLASWRGRGVDAGARAP
ncbi:type II CAAX prenyl endopeptidase Rce1 family protein [Roseococcus sp.]|uniref:CPBP family glutamic-type intramembrane protease n=1 Tax=Roseococcus sp. TaxID=2109646 RepID=UPI003BA86BF3